MNAGPDVHEIPGADVGGIAVSASLLLGIPSPDLGTLATLAGFDSVILDCEHGFPLDSTVRSMILAVKSRGGQCIVRLAKDAVGQVGALADVGLDGILLAGPEHLHEMTAVVGLAAFPGHGTRSVNPFVPAAVIPGDVGRLQDSAKSFELWAMAEHPTFLAELDEFSVSGEDVAGWTGIIIGPYDLAASLGCDPDPADAVLLDAVHRFARAARRLGLKCGLFARDGDTLRRWRALGIQPDLAVMGYDRDVWFQECRRRVDHVRGRGRQE